ncbi:hypothetical protein LTR56_015610 [Elasticomyces elasticus]|nr:hypothetical protein LTR56_015610 [Elasticomyces elasticus]KAK3652538.1 hypothetical protein LTR22_011625 [Elasticomyces elasticus]KAK4919243.1 hypothetical protein LTR49_013090 [Elasticomyces elasticus]KAK5757800.1 hypothetical protein LTS12_012118 [Elasticomyces elasticus]
MSRHYSTFSHDSDLPLPLYTPTVTAQYSTFVQNLPPPAYTPTSSVAGVYENVPPPSYTVAVPVERGWSLMALWHRENVFQVTYTARDEIDDAESGRSMDGREHMTDRRARSINLLVLVLLVVGLLVFFALCVAGWVMGW